MWDKLPPHIKTKMLTEHGNTVPLGRSGEAHEIGEAIVSLLSNKYITGQTLFVDGGASIRP